MPKDAWRPLTGFYAEAGATNPPLLHEKPEIRNMTELACLTISRSHARCFRDPAHLLGLSRLRLELGTLRAAVENLK